MAHRLNRISGTVANRLNFSKMRGCPIHQRFRHINMATFAGVASVKWSGTTKRPNSNQQRH